MAAAPPTEEQSVHPTPSSQSLIHMSMTRTGAVVGTPAYMAPEQFLSEPTDARTDQFSFCVAAYEALYGERPFKATSYEAQLERVLEGLPKVSNATERAVPQWIREVLIKGLAPTSEERFPDMAALLRALDSPPENEPKTVTGPPPREVRQWMLPVVIGSTVAVIAAMILVSIAPWNTPVAPAEQPQPVSVVEKPPAPVPAPTPAPIAAPPPPVAVPAAAAPAPVVAAKKVRKKVQKPTTAKPTPVDDSKLKPFND